MEQSAAATRAEDERSPVSPLVQASLHSEEYAGAVRIVGRAVLNGFSRRRYFQSPSDLSGFVRKPLLVGEAAVSDGEKKLHEREIDDGISQGDSFWSSSLMAVFVGKYVLVRKSRIANSRENIMF